MTFEAALQKNWYADGLKQMTEHQLMFKALAYLVASSGARSGDPLLDELHQRAGSWPTQGRLPD